MFRVSELVDKDKEIEKIMDIFKKNEEEEKFRKKYDNNRYRIIDYKIPEDVYVYSGKNKKIKRKGENFYFVEIFKIDKSFNNQEKYGLRHGVIKIEKRMKNKEIFKRCEKNNIKVLDFLECPRILVLEEMKNYPFKKTNFEEAFKAFHEF